MKKSITLILLVFAVMISANGQESLAGHFSVGLNAFGPIGKHDTVEPSSVDAFTGYMKYWGMSAEGAFRLGLYKRFQFHPAISLYYENHNPVGQNFITGGPQSLVKRGHVNEVGFDIALPFGFAIPSKIGLFEIETGPVLGFYVYQRNEISFEDNLFEPKEYTDPFKRFKARWRFAVQYNFCAKKLYAKLALDLSMTNYTDSQPYHGYDKDYRCRNVLSGGIGWNF